MKWAVLILSLVLVLALGALVHHRLAHWQGLAATTTTTKTPSSAGRIDAMSGDGIRAQAPLGQGDDDADADWPRLKFTITNVRRNRQMTPQPPYHQEGGTWTVFDCHLAAGAGGSGGAAGTTSPSVFTVAVATPTPADATGDVPVAFSNVMLLPPDGAHGANLVAALARAFRHDAPAPRAIRTPLAPVTFRTVHLGDALQAHPEGGYGGSGGNWTATKWFTNTAGYEAEVFFNYNLADGVGEFAEKDSDYREDLLQVIALAVRDGPRPPRTPANDPNLAAPAAGPRIEDLRPIPDSHDAQYVFSPGGGRLIVYKSGGRSDVLMIDPANVSSSPPTPVARFEGWVSEVICFDDDVARIAVEEQMVGDRRSFSGETPSRLWIVERVTGARKAIEGPWGAQGALFADMKVLAPGGRYLAIHARATAATATTTTTGADGGDGGDGAPATGRRQRPQAAWYLYDTATGSSVRANLAAVTDVPDIEFVGWTGRGAQLHAVVKTGERYDDEVRRQTLLIDPATGAAAPSSVQPASVDPALSPDGRFRMSLTPRKQLDVLDLAGGRLRTFAFHEDDRRFAADESVFAWLSPRYIRFDTQRPGFIDVRTMKLSYLPRVASATAARGDDGDGDGDANVPYFTYSPDFKWAVTRGREEGLLIGRVVVPSD